MSLQNSLSFLLNFSEDDMHGEIGHVYEFMSFRLNLAERQLLNNGAAVPLTPKAFDVLAVLVVHAGHLVEKEELMRLVWPDSFVEEANVARIIHTLRKVLDEDESGNKFIETVARKGYRFVADVKKVTGNGSTLPLFVSGDNVAQGNLAPAEGAPRLPDAADVTGQTRRRFALITAATLVAVVSVGGFTFFRGYWPARSVVNKLTPETFSGEALQLYNQGRLLVERRHDGDYPKALEMFEKAIGLDPNYANAYAGKADVKIVVFWRSGEHDDIIEARTAAKKAIELDETNSYAHAVYCRILTTYDYNHQEADKECRKAVELDPNDHEAQKEFAFFLHSLGRESEALATIEKAIAIAPTSFNKRSRGMILYQSGHYDEAIAQLEQVEQTDPLYKETTRWLIRAHEMKKDYPRALESYSNLMAHSGATSEGIAAVRAAFEQDGWPAVLRTMIDSPNMRTLFQAGTLAQLGEKEKAFEPLEDMFKRRAILLITIAREPTLEPLRADPRFNDLLKRIGLK